MRGIPATVAGAAAVLAGCFPALNWREVRPENSGATVLMPCRPAAQARTVALAGQTLHLQLSVCSASGMTWALATAEVPSEEAVDRVLDALATAAKDNISAGKVSGSRAAVPGALPDSRSRRLDLVGTPRGRAQVQEVVVVAARGTRVFQATALGERLDPEAVDTFLSSLDLTRR